MAEGSNTSGAGLHPLCFRGMQGLGRKGQDLLSPARTFVHRRIPAVSTQVLFSDSRLLLSSSFVVSLHLLEAVIQVKKVN